MIDRELEGHAAACGFGCAEFVDLIQPGAQLGDLLFESRDPRDSVQAAWGLLIEKGGSCRRCLTQGGDGGADLWRGVSQPGCLDERRAIIAN
jgi:hypothetical protein